MPSDVRGVAGDGVERAGGTGKVAERGSVSLAP
jgi:hypothetical protein